MEDVTGHDAAVGLLGLGDATQSDQSLEKDLALYLGESYDAAVNATKLIKDQFVDIDNRFQNLLAILNESGVTVIGIASFPKNHC